MRKGYVAWNYREADTAGLDELPDDFADYVPDAARYRERIAVGDTPVGAALKELSASNAFGEREIETYKKLLAGWEYTEATTAACGSLCCGCYPDYGNRLKFN